MKYFPQRTFLGYEAFGQQRLPHLAARVGSVEVVGRFGRDHASQVGSLHLADSSGLLDECIGVRNLGRDHTTHDAAIAQMAHQGAGIDLGQNRHAVALHVLVGHLFGAPVRADLGEFADDQAFDVRPGGLIVSPIRAVIANLGVGEDDDLPCVRGIGRNFLVSGKRSIENDFALAFARVSMAVPTEDAPVFEREDRLHRLSEEWIQSILAGYPESFCPVFPRA